MHANREIQPDIDGSGLKRSLHKIAMINASFIRSCNRIKHHVAVPRAESKQCAQELVWTVTGQ